MRSKYSSVPTGEYDDEVQNHGNYGKNGIQMLKSGLKDQNEKLDMLGHSVTKLGEMSLGISKEIDTQNRMLSKLETDIEEGNATANNLTLKTKELIKRSGGPKNFCIIMTLLAILVILILLVIYT